MPTTQRIAVEKILRDALNPRTDWASADLLPLGLNIKEHGQHQPILVYKDGDNFRLLDGERRLRSAPLAGLTELDAVVLPARPTENEIAIAQMNIEAQKVGLSPMERSHLLQRIMKKTNWSVTELSQHLHIKQPLVTKLLSYQKAHPDVQDALHKGTICMERAYVISGFSDPAKQLELLKQAGDLTRDQLRRRAHGDGQTELKASTAKFPLASGMVVTVRGHDFNLSQTIEVLQDIARDLRVGQKQGLDISTAQKIFADKARSKP